MTAPATSVRHKPQPRCPLRPKEPCTLCQLDVTGPQDCPVVYLVRADDELLADWASRNRAARGL